MNKKVLIIQIFFQLGHVVSNDMSSQPDYQNLGCTELIAAMEATDKVKL